MCEKTETCALQMHEIAPIHVALRDSAPGKPQNSPGIDAMYFPCRLTGFFPPISHCVKQDKNSELCFLFSLWLQSKCRKTYNVETDIVSKRILDKI